MTPAQEKEARGKRKKDAEEKTKQHPANKKRVSWRNRNTGAKGRWDI
jgi:hypothetical protein